MLAAISTFRLVNCLTGLFTLKSERYLEGTFSVIAQLSSQLYFTSDLLLIAAGQTRP